MLDKFHVVTPEFTREVFSGLFVNSTRASEWVYHFSGIFAEFTPVHLSLPADGWKLRANVRLEEVPRLLRVVVPILRRYKFAFKILADPMFYRACFSKQLSAGEAGKFLTVYIPTAAELTLLVRELDAVIADLVVDPCAPPVSDAPVPFSKNLSYRYGSFTNSNFIRVSDGQVVEDCRDFFQLPPGIEDPFMGVGEYDNDEADEPVEIGGNYEIASVLHRTYPSAIYVGVRQSDGLEIILKEARPNAYVADILATERLENEYLILREVSGCSDLCPTPLEIFEVEKHLFLAMTNLRGTVSLYEWREDNRTPAAHLHIGKKISEVLVRLHSELSIAWGDIHASNVLIDDSEDKVYLIDPEFAKHTRDFTADIQMFGRLLLWLVFEVDTIFEPDCHPDFFLQRLARRSDYNPTYINAIHSALSGGIKSQNDVDRLLKGGV